MRHLSLALLLVLIVGCQIPPAEHAGSGASGQRSAAPPPAELWPTFRGLAAAGVADGQHLPDRWNGETGEHVLWKVPVPGLAHSSPVIWGDRLFVTTAVSSKQDASFRHGLYGAGDASPDQTVHRWQLWCLDKHTGKVIWQHTAHEGVPKDKRHIKATYANASPAVDGRYVAAMFGSEGLYVYDMKGELLWKRDFGILNLGAYDAPTYEWGSASSPIFHKGLVILQCDTQAEDFIVACDARTGRIVWKTQRDELPSWGTPTIYEGSGREELITNASKFIRGYDPMTGKELWRLGGSSQITAPTPIYHDNLIVVTSGRRPVKPIFVLRAGAEGDISLDEGQTSSDAVVWSKTGRGPYMPTPIIYRDLLYTLNNDGVFFCYRLRSGEDLYRKRLPHVGGGFSASPVAADGKLYLPGEDGEIFVVNAGEEYQLLATNALGERIMASPALSSGMMFVRAEHHLFAIGK